jgi:hypothetical protein
MDLARLQAKLLEVLAEGGPRKPAILRALNRALGGDEFQFVAAVRALRAGGMLRVVHRQGGPHYGLTRRARLDCAPETACGNGLRTRAALYTIARSRSKNARSKNKNKGAA